MTIKTDISLVVFKHTQGGYEQRRAGLQMPPFPGFCKMFTSQSTLGCRHYGSPPGEACSVNHYNEKGPTLRPSWPKSSRS